MAPASVLVLLLAPVTQAFATGEQPLNDILRPFVPAEALSYIQAGKPIPGSSGQPNSEMGTLSAFCVPSAVCVKALEFYNATLARGSADPALARELEALSRESRRQNNALPLFDADNPDLYIPLDMHKLSQADRKNYQPSPECQRDPLCLAAVAWNKDPSQGNWDAFKSVRATALSGVARPGGRGDVVAREDGGAASRGAGPGPEERRDAPQTRDERGGQNERGPTPKSDPQTPARNDPGSHTRNERGGNDYGSSYSGNDSPGRSTANSRTPSDTAQIGKGLANSLKNGKDAFKNETKDPDAADLKPGGNANSRLSALRPGAQRGRDRPPPPGSLSAGAPPASGPELGGTRASGAPGFQLASAVGGSGFSASESGSKKGSSLPDIPSRFTRQPGEIPAPGSFSGSARGASSGAGPEFGGSRRPESADKKLEDGQGEGATPAKPGEDSLSADELKQLEEIEKLLKDAGTRGELDLNALDQELRELENLQSGGKGSVFGGEVQRRVSRLRLMAGNTLSPEQQQELTALAQSMGLSIAETRRLIRAVEVAAPSAPGGQSDRFWLWLFKLLAVFKKGWKLSLALLVAIFLSWQIFKKV